MERALAGEQHVRDDAECPHIDARVIVVLALFCHPELGRHVRGRAELVPHGLLARLNLASESKVNQLELGVLALQTPDAYMRVRTRRK